MLMIGFKSWNLEKKLKYIEKKYNNLILDIENEKKYKNWSWYVEKEKNFTDKIEKTVDKFGDRQEAQKIYAELAKEYGYEKFIDKITDQELLLDVAKNSVSDCHRKTACEKTGGHHFGKNCVCEICRNELHDFDDEKIIKDEEDEKHYISTCRRCGAVKHKIIYEICEYCGGVGTQESYDGIIYCYYCNGSGKYPTMKKYIEYTDGTKKDWEDFVC